MPAKTVYFDDKTFRYAHNSKDDDQSVGQRLAELAKEGMGAEQ